MWVCACSAGQKGCGRPVFVSTRVSYFSATTEAGFRCLKVKLALGRPLGAVAPPDRWWHNGRGMCGKEKALGS